MGSLMDENEVLVDKKYLLALQRDSSMLECLDACGAPSLPIWDEALEMFEVEWGED